jgi:hypothetical protein
MVRAGDSAQGHSRPCAPMTELAGLEGVCKGRPGVPSSRPSPDIWPAQGSAATGIRRASRPDRFQSMIRWRQLGARLQPGRTIGISEDDTVGIRCQRSLRPVQQHQHIAPRIAHDRASADRNVEGLHRHLTAGVPDRRDSFVSGRYRSVSICSRCVWRTSSASVSGMRRPADVLVRQISSCPS